MTPPSVIVAKPGGKGRTVLSAVRPLRIATLSIHSSPLGKLGTENTGGMSVYIRELSRELGIAGHSVDIYTCADSGTRDPELFLSDNVRLIHLDIGSHRHVTKDVLAGNLPEVFHSLEAYITRNPVCYDIIHSHYWLSGGVGTHAQDRWYIPHVLMFHTTGIAKRIACSQEREPSFRLLAEKGLARRSDRILTATEREKNMLMRFYGTPEKKIGLVPCGVNLRRFQLTPKEIARKELGLQDTRFLILYVGRFAPVKGLDRLIAAAAHLGSRSGITFVIIGGDGYRTDASAELLRVSKRASLEDVVKFRGRVEHDLLPLYYSAADALVMPSYYESFGLVALESLACGTPVIATRVGAMDALIRDGKTGLLVDDPGPRPLASAIERLVALSSKGGLSPEEIRGSVLGYGWSDIASAVIHEYATVLHPRVAWR